MVIVDAVPIEWPCLTIWTWLTHVKFTGRAPDSLPQSLHGRCGPVARSEEATLVKSCPCLQELSLQYGTVDLDVRWQRPMDDHRVFPIGRDEAEDAVQLLDDLFPAAGFEGETVLSVLHRFGFS